MKRSRVAGWIGLTLLALGVLWTMFSMIARRAELGLESDQVLLPALALAVLLALGLAGVLIRNLVRLIVDRKRGILGAKLRTKLVFFFLALVLLPAIVLFAGSAKIIHDTVEAILLARSPEEELMRESRAIVDRWSEYFQSRCLAEAEALARVIEADGLLDPARASELGDAVERWRERQSLQFVRVGRAAGALVAGSEARDAVPRKLEPAALEILTAEIDEAARTRRPVQGISRLGEGLLAHGAAPLSHDNGIAVVTGAVLPRDIASRWEPIDIAWQDYRRFKVERRDLVRLYVTLIGIIFLATLFVATWIGFYISRRITVPIQDLATAAREISAGNLGVRVQAQVGDELGTLVDAFNEMAGELQENREVITRSTAELRRSNQALEERRRYIETLVAHLSTGVISLDPQGKVTTANPAVQRILGVRLAPGDAIRALLEQHALGPLEDLLDSVTQLDGESVRRDLELRRQGSVLNLSVQISPLVGSAAEDRGTLIMVEDLTDLLRAQKALAWQDVARRIAHEIKNPLTPIQLAAQRLRKKFHDQAPDLDQVLLEATASIEREVAGLKQLVDEFQAFARMPEVRPQPVEFGRVVESVLALYKGLSGVRWDVDLDPRSGPVNMDAAQMRRAMINLIDNAVSAMSGRGSIRIATRTMADRRALRIEIADSGPGIPPADRDKMFAPYFSTKARGTGLGLAIVHKVITDHRGTIRVEENPPHGARFVIEIPA